jgi:hypothetical protein
MDIEKTLRAIADSQLRAERRMDMADQRADRADQRADRADQRADRADKRMDKLEQQMRTTYNLVRAGMKMVVEMRTTQAEIKRAQKEWDFKYNALIDSQMRTDEALRKTDEAVRKTDEKFNRLTRSSTGSLRRCAAETATDTNNRSIPTAGRASPETLESLPRNPRFEITPPDSGARSVRPRSAPLHDSR